MPKIRPADNIPPLPAPGQYTFPVQPAVSATSAGLGNATLRLSPFWLPRPCKFDRIGGEVTVIGDAGSVLRMGIYADNGYCSPSSLILDAGTIDTGSSTGAKEKTIALALGMGMYWIGGVVQLVTTTQPTIRSISGSAAFPTLLSAGTLIGNTQTMGSSMNGITDVLPATYVPATYSVGVVPRLFLRMA